MLLENKSIVITGCGGIGKEIVLQLLNHKPNKITIIARNIKQLTELRGLCETRNVKCDIIVLDITNKKRVSIAIANLTKKPRFPDILINNAGILNTGLFTRINFNKLEKEVTTNYLGLLHITQLFCKRWIKYKQAGLVVNVSSLSSNIASPNMANYSATKSAITQLSNSIRIELEPYNIRVINVVPTLVETNMVKDISRNGIYPISPSYVASEILLNLDKDEIVIGNQAKLALWLHKISPSITNVLSRFVIN